MFFMCPLKAEPAQVTDQVHGLAAQRALLKILRLIGNYEAKVHQDWGYGFSNGCWHPLLIHFGVKVTHAECRRTDGYRYLTRECVAYFG
jgi:hypothetical protein